MRKIFKLLGIFALVSVIGFSMTACDNGTGGDTHTHDFSGAWTVISTTYPAQSAQKCTGCSATGGTPRSTALGDTGPGGGIIFYVSTTAFDTNKHYLEVSPANLTGGTGSEATMRWTTATGSPYPATSGTLETIGSGKNNTAIIIAAESAAYPGDTYIYAARACIEYRGGGKTDWFLPSKDELNEMYNARTYVGISTEYFWSSSQSVDYDNYAWGQNFDLGNQTYGNKYGVYSVRAVRAF